MVPRDDEPASPARLYAAVAGALLFLLGIVGFFYGSSFGAPGEVAPGLAGLRVNAWLNLLYAALGALGLLLAGGGGSRAYALGAGALLTALGVWGLALEPGAAILGFIPAAGTDEALALVLGLLGLLAAAGTPRRRRADFVNYVHEIGPSAKSGRGRARSGSAGR
ncbi:MAG: DUF4383 domain-containing protein [Solirubrobacterales bacterium]